MKALTAYPELLQRRETIASVVRIEEQKFLETLDSGTRRLDELMAAARKQKDKKKDKHKHDD